MVPVCPGETDDPARPLTRQTLWENSASPSARGRSVAYPAVALSQASVHVGRVVAGRYRLIAPLGAGASARVYLAEDTELARRVAVKVLHDAAADDAAFLKRFRSEARAAASLSHPNIVHVYDSGTDEGVPYLVCEYLGGGSLRDMLTAGRTLTPSQALLVGLEVARGLAHAHRRGFVHRDIKPANLLFGEDGRLRIADFGLARAIAEAAWTEPQGVLLGTARYASPEQARGQHLDGRSDVYSLALVLVEALSGRVPFAADTTTATLMGRCEKDMPVPDGLGQFGTVIARAGRLDPELRPDAGELELSLLAAAEELDRPSPLPLARVDLGALVGDAPSDDITIVLPEPRPRAGAAGPDASTEPEEVGEGADQPDDATLEGAPPPRRRRQFTALALLTLAVAGLLAWALLRTPVAEVPVLTGRTVAEARRLATSQGWTVTTVMARRDGTRPDEVIEQSPPSGTTLARGEQIRLTVSLGNTLTAVPALVGLPEEQALAALSEAGLAPGDVDRPYDETVEVGVVISATPRTVNETGQAPRETPVDLVVSAGPAPRTIPAGLVGQSIDVARRLLGDLQLGVEVTEAYSEAPVGTVLASDQVDGATVPRGTAVKLTVSKGPEPRPIPDVAGRTVSDATAILSRAGFVVSGVEGSPTTRVLATDPPAGEAHLPGRSVRLFTRR